MKDLLHIKIEQLNALDILDWGYTEDLIPTTLKKYEKWVEKKLHQPLSYMGDERFEKRKNLKNFYPECKSALVFLFPYITEKKAQQKLNLKTQISSYAYAFEGIDYHYAIKERLEKIKTLLKESDSSIEVNFSIDAQPVLERDLAYKTGLGWFGKNSMIINKEHGSYFFIASILVNKKLEIKNINKLETDHCGTCTNCIDDCPTLAIDPNTRTIITDKCISTYTIELFKDETSPPKGYENQSYVFGCDICQEVCPWNTKPITNAKEINLDKKIHHQLNQTANLENIDQLKNESNRSFRKIFEFSPISRTGKIGFLKNISNQIRSLKNS